MVRRRGARYSRGGGLLTSMENRGGPAGGPLCHRRVSLIGQDVTVGVGRRGDDLVATSRVHVVTSQVRHGRGQCHVWMILRVVMIVGLRTVMHVRELSLVIITTVRCLIGVIILPGILGRIHGCGCGGARCPGEASRMIIAMMDLIH